MKNKKRIDFNVTASEHEALRIASLRDGISMTMAIRNFMRSLPDYSGEQDNG